MYLRLTASTDTGDYLATFGHSVGTIGRSDDCTLSLPDPERFVSRFHAEIHYSSGKYYIRDLSANGVYLNDGDAPLGKGTDKQAAHTAGSFVSCRPTFPFRETGRQYSSRTRSRDRVLWSFADIPQGRLAAEIAHVYPRSTTAHRSWRNRGA